MNAGTQDLESIARIANHDLKEPLRMIESFTGLITDEIADADSPELRLYATHIVDGTRRMRRMIDNVVSISRLHDAPVTRSIDLNPVLGRVRTEAVRARPEAKVEVDELPSVHGHAYYLSVLFGNLVENGLRYNRSDIPEVRVGAEPLGSDWCVHVTDNGIGIAPEDHERVFEMFVRVDEMTGGVAGTGIGLAVARRIARAFGGDVTLNSARGEGTTLSVLLPGESR